MRSLYEQVKEGIVLKAKAASRNLEYATILQVARHLSSFIHSPKTIQSPTIPNFLLLELTPPLIIF